jgi:hypothetical protein
MFANSDERMELSFTAATDPRQRSHSRVSPDPHFVYKVQDSPKLKGEFPVLISPKNRVSQLHPRALGSLFSATTTRGDKMEAL